MLKTFLDWLHALDQGTVLILIVILTLVVVALTVIALLVVDGIHKDQMEKVRNTSKRYRALLELNERYDFHENIKTFKDLHWNVSTKPKFDRFNFHQRFLEVLECDGASYAFLIQQADENRRTYKAYQEELWNLPDYVQNRTDYEVVVPLRRYQKYEEELCEEAELHPVTDIKFRVFVRYQSPAGRNIYNNYKFFSISDVLDMFDEIKEAREHRKTAEYQRSLMSESLRYDVLKRDGFRCTLCGRTAQDGVKLHVDHIKPIAKGGKTKMSNLRTLCDECNRGKSDKWDEYGDN